MKVAALDLGTNTFLMLIANVKQGLSLEVLEDHITVTRLGQGVHLTGKFHAEALERAENCFRRYGQILQETKVDKVIAVATAAARDVKNSEELFRMGQKYGIPIEVISGDREAQLTFLGSTFDQTPEKSVAVIDVGGGSTEVIIGKDGQFVEGQSLPLGSVRLTEQFISKHPVEQGELSKLKAHITEVFESSSLFGKRVQQVVAVAGTPTTLACLEQKTAFREELIHGHVLDLNRMKNWVNRMADMDVEERMRLPGMEPKRADVVVAGASILHQLSAMLGVPTVKTSTKGVRYGVALSWEEF